MNIVTNGCKISGIIITLFTFVQGWSQPSDDYVKSIEKLRSEGKLTTRSSTDRTFAGSVTGYYHDDCLVLINSLTDAEEAGTETLYFFKDGILKNVFIIAATFDSHEEWKEYYSKHKSVNKCYSCHGKPKCIVTEITLGNKPTVIATRNKKILELNREDKERLIVKVQRESDELKTLLKIFK